MSQPGRVIAIVDDDNRVLESLEDLLESAGYRVRGFNCAQTFLSEGLADIDGLISDIGMPGIDGFELIERARRLEPDLPVFLITGRHDIVERPQASRAIVHGYFRKPFDTQHLLAEIARAIDERGGQRNS